MPVSAPPAQRIDKWLWFARFFKTRSLAAEAVKAGHVDINGSRAKPGKAVRAGDEIVLKKPPYRYTLEVLETGERRGGAEEARQMYRESEASRSARAAVAEQLELGRQQSLRRGKLSKRERREFERTRRSGWDESGS